MSAISEGIGDIEQLDENLRKWFKEKWVRFGPDGKIRGACARGDDSEGKPKCLPQKKAQNLGKKGRKYAASKKRREDPNPERIGKAKNVATKKKTNEDIPFNECPSCRGPIVHESMMNEKQDACYHKVKSRYKVWPSAYASGALVQCRKKGASNWGTGGKKKNESSIMKGIVGEARAKPYVKPFIENGKQVGWKSSDGYHVKYWQMFAKDSAIKHAKLNPDEVQEDYTGEFAAEKTPAINPYGGLKDNKFRGAISETPTDNPTGASGEGGWRTYKPKPAGQIKEDEKLDAMFEPTIDKLHNLVDYEIKNAGIMLTDDPYEDISKILLGLGLSKEEASDYELIDAILDKMEDNGTYDELWEDTAYAGGMGQGGNAGQSYRKFKPKSAGTFKEAAGQKYEVRFANGKTQRFVAVSPEEAKKKAKGLGASSLIKINKDGMPKGKVEEEQIDEYREVSPELRAAQANLIAIRNKQKAVNVPSKKERITKDKVEIDKPKPASVLTKGSQDVDPDTMDAIAAFLAKGGEIKKGRPGKAPPVGRNQASLHIGGAGSLRRKGDRPGLGANYRGDKVVAVEEEQLDEKCWDTHKQVGMKTKGGKSVPNCVPKESAIMKGINRLI